MKQRANPAFLMCLLCALLSIPVSSLADTRFVNVNSTNPVSPFTSWSTAAQTIQDAADIAADGDLVLVTNGHYQVGGLNNFPEFSGLTNRLVITNAITVKSVNGPGVTFIVGSGPLGDAAIRGVAMAPGSVLNGFTVSNGCTMSSGEYFIQQSGGGVWCSDESCVLTNCVIAGNNASIHGGGVFQGSLYNCTVTGNFAPDSGGGVYWGELTACTIQDNLSFLGGGVYDSVLLNCTLSGNFGVLQGGGAYGGELYHCTVVTNFSIQSAAGVYFAKAVNCIVYFNDCTNNPNYEGGTIDYTCTDPLPSGNGNITNEPIFVSMAADNFRLMSNAPCVDAGTNDVAVLDKDGVPRPLDGNLDGTNTADMGAYEFVHPAGDSDHDGMLDPWEIAYRLNPLVPTDAGQDPDLDGPVSLDEFIAGTDPNNSNSWFHFTQTRLSTTNEVVTWSSATGRVYVLERMTGLTGDTWSVTASGLGSHPPLNTYTDNVPSQVQFYYRVWVQRTNAYYPP
jgi:hypothetical protein